MMSAPPLLRPLLLATLVSLFVSGCQHTPKPPVEAKQTLDQAIANQQAAATTPMPPAAVLDELLPASSTPASLAGSLQGERRLDISAEGVDAPVFFAGLVDGSRYSLVVHPEVTGTITLQLSGVTLGETLDLVSRLYGDEIKRQGNIISVLPATLRTETFAINYLFLKRFGDSRTTITSTRLTDSSGNSNDDGGFNDSRSDGGDSANGGRSGSSASDVGGTRIHTQSTSDYWPELQALLTSMVGDGDGRRVIVSPQSGLVTVRALPAELRQVREYLQQAEGHLRRQVLLEAKIVEVTLSDGFQQGINWNVLGSPGDGSVGFTTSPGTVGNTITNAIGGVTGITLSSGDFNAVVSLLETQGNTNVLSSPRITATNNQKAVIKVGDDEYFVTDISTTTTVSGTTPITNPSVELTPFFSGIALDVTPQIDEAGNVLLHVHPSITDVQEQKKVITLGSESLELPLARSNIRETDTIIRARSGDVVVIGGLMKTIRVEDQSKVPLLGDVPWMGELFTNRSNREVKTELVIMLKPTLIGSDTWEQELQRSRATLEQWFPDQGSKR